MKSVSKELSPILQEFNVKKKIAYENGTKKTFVIENLMVFEVLENFVGKMFRGKSINENQWIDTERVIHNFEQDNGN